VAAALAAVCGAWQADGPRAEPFRFVILGDRTGEAQPGVYEAAWRDAATENPAFIIATGDSIQGGDHKTAEAEWQAVRQVWQGHHRYPLYLVPGNHDIWSAASEALFRKYAGRGTQYGFDYGGAHFTVLDNSRTGELTSDALRFLESDLREHAGQPLKFIFSHRPSWIVNAAIDNPAFPMHQLARRYGAGYVVAGHIHQLVRARLESVTYLSMPSSGGHLRLSGRYEDGWFFGYAVVEVRGGQAAIRIKELKPPHGRGRATGLEDWGKTGLRPAVAPR
jgi:predicted phosphodiesterase